MTRRLGHVARPAGRARRACIIRHGFFPLDTRVRREARALVDAGYEVDVVCVRRPGEPRREQLGGVTVHRLPLPLERGGRLRYAAQYLSLLAVAGAFAAVLGLRRRWDVVQVNSMPDMLVFAALIPRWLGAGVVLDLHECMPEFFATKYGVGFDHPAVRLLAHLEQAAIRFADRAITCTDQMRDAFTARGAPPQKIEVVLNAADETIFDVRRYERSARRPGRFRLICHGAIEERYGLDTILRAVALLRDEIPGLSVAFYGDGTQRPQLERLAAELGVADAVWFSDGWAPLDELLTGIADADAGVVAIRRDAFRDLTHCNKMFDYIAMRCPAIVSRTRSVEAYFDESCFLFFDSGDEHDLARAVRVLHDDRQLGERLARSAAEAAEPYRWARQREAYVRAFVAVANRRRRRATPAPVPTPPRDAAA